MSPENMRLYQTALQQGKLPLRLGPMLLMSPTGAVDEQIERLENLAEWRDYGDGHLRTWGIKIVADG